MSDLGDTSSGGGSPSSGGSSSSSLFSSPLALGAAGVGALGLGALIAQGPGQLPSQFGQATEIAPWEINTGQQTIGQGQTLVNQGTQAVGMAQAGQLTPEQAAQLEQYSSGLTNQSRQMFYSMGQNPDKSTGFVTQTGNIDAQVNAMAQQEIQTTLQIGLGEISSGNSLMATGGSEISAATQALMAAGEAQLKLDTSYSSNLTSAFGAIGSMFGALGGAALKAAPVLAV
jgi:hypothetical protein